MMTAPLFSIVTVVFNGARTIESTICSVIAQSRRDFEYIVLDGGSTDGTQELLQQYDNSIDHWSSEPDSGIYNAWNKALQLVRGEWIAFLGADDVYHVDALQHYAAAIAAPGAADLHYLSSRVQLVKAGKAVRVIGSAWSWPEFAHHMTVAHVGSMHRRTLFEEFGSFNESYRICGDYELLLRPRERLRAAFLDRITASMAFGGVSNSKVQLALEEQERAKRTAGGRQPWRCALERRTAYMRDWCRSLLWY